jgi:sugar phosphate isomerase/epimerase
MEVASAHLTYCSNIHPGETWAEVKRQLAGPVLAVREQFPEYDRFGIGLRLSAAAAASLQTEAELGLLQSFLLDNGLYIFTLNGFPYGNFHGRPVKESVYLPDWRQSERSAYTAQLVNVLAKLLPPGQRGSISTVPGGFKAHLDESGIEAIAARLLEQVVALHDVARETGSHIVLALEPEPCCLLETTAETVAFFHDHLLTQRALASIQSMLQLQNRETAEAIVRSHLGVCVDTCHAAVEFETADATVDALQAAGIQIAKLQLSAGMLLAPRNLTQLDHVMQYDEQVYLHQVVSRDLHGNLSRFADLPEAYASTEARNAEEWRVHFHVPIYSDRLSHLESTQAYLVDMLARHRREQVSTHLEVETYTFDVLPEDQRQLSVEDSIARELHWTLDQLHDV